MDTFENILERNAATIEKVGAIALNSPKTPYTTYEPSMDNFHRTNLDRKFFGDEKNSGLAYAWYRSENSSDAHEVIRDKHIMMIGGGNSLLDLRNQDGFQPASYIDIEPHAIKRGKGRDDDQLYKVARLSIVDPDFLTKFHTQYPDS